MTRGLRTRLAAVMFLEYAVQGLWVVPLAAFLMGSPHEGGLNMPAGHVALIYATLSIGATLSPLLVGLLADRLFQVQRVLAVLHLVGAVLLAGALLWSVRCQGHVKAAFFAATVDSDAGYAVRDDIARIDYLRDYLRDPDPERFRQRWRDRNVTWTDKLRYRLGLDRVDPDWRFDLSFAMALQDPLFGPFKGDPYPPPQKGQTELDRLCDQTSPLIQHFRTHPAVTAAADRAFPPLFALMLAYACVYLPTIPLSNVVAFRNLPDPGRQYGPFRAAGTVGWIAAGLLVGFAAPAVSPLCFLYAAVASAVLGVICFLLPHTPPAGKPRTVGDALGLPALKMLADRSFLAYVLAALAATTLMPFHNSFANKFLVDLHVDHAAAVQTLAQPTEILGALLIPWVWTRIGIKRMLCLGLLSSAVRFFMYATESVPAVIGIGFPLHGIGFALFYIAAALYVDRQAPTDLRASAQGLVTVVTLGFGGVLGNWFAGRVVEWHTAGGVVDWRPVWLLPAAGTLLAAGVVAVFFRERRPTTRDASTRDPLSGEPQATAPDQLRSPAAPR